MNKTLLVLSVAALVTFRFILVPAPKWQDVVVIPDGNRFQLDPASQAAVVPITIANRSSRTLLSRGCPRAPRLTLEIQLGGSWHEHSRLSTGCEAGAIHWDQVGLAGYQAIHASALVRASGRYRVRFYYFESGRGPSAAIHMQISPAFDVAPSASPRPTPMRVAA